MSIGSGLAGSVGLKEQTVYPTYSAPDRWVEPTGEVSWKEIKEIYQGGGVAAGRMVQPGSMRIVTARSAAGALPLEVRNKKAGIILRSIFGGAPTPVIQNTSTGYLQAFTLTDNWGRFLGGQVGIPDTTGTVRPYSYIGGKVLSAEFTLSNKGVLMMNLDMDFHSLTEAQVLAAASYVTGQTPFSFANWTPKLGTVGSEVAVPGVRSFSLKIERPQDTEMYYGGNAGRKSEPIMNDWVKITQSIEVDYQVKGDFADRFAADTSTSVVHEFTGAALGGAPAISELFRLRAPQTYFDEGTPTLSGPGVVTTTFSATSQFDLTNSPVSCDYISLDTAA